MYSMEMKNTDKPLAKDSNDQNKNTDKIWCPEGEHYQHVEGCMASCKKLNRCEAYSDYREPKLI